MKIAIITSKYPSSLEPYSHMFVHERVKELKKLDVDVSVFVCTNTELSYSFEGVFVNQLNYINICKQLSNFDVVYLHLLNMYPLEKANGWPIYKFIAENRIPFGMYIHGNEVQKYKARKYEYNYSIKETLKWFKKDFWVIPKMKKFIGNAIHLQYGKFIFPSRWMHVETQRNLGVEIKEPIFIPNGINTSFYSYIDTSQNRFKLLSIRSLSAKVYDIEKTIEVMELLPTKYTLTLIGKGKYIGVYKKLIAKKNLITRIKIIERFLQPKEMLAAYRKHGVFISTTRQDSQGITILEAMSAGLLGVSTLNTAKPEFIMDGQTGLLELESKKIADRIVKITENVTQFKEITLRASVRFKLLNNKDLVKKELDQLRIVCKK
jgi:glycosyltransferase involved in cell wall biosynthesis